MQPIRRFDLRCKGEPKNLFLIADIETVRIEANEAPLIALSSMQCR